MYYVVMVIVIKSFIPTMPDSVYLKISEPDFYNYGDCQELLQDFRKDMQIWFRQQNKKGHITWQCKYLPGAHKA